MILKGIDTLEFGLKVENYLEQFGPMLQTLAQLKKDAQDTDKEYEIEINNVTVKVHRNGIPFYAYKISCNDWFMFFMEKEMQTNPPIKIRFLASYLWSYGYKGAFDNFFKWLEYTRLLVPETVLSRVDICVDLDEKKFVESDIKGVVTKARGKKKYFVNDEFENGRKFSGFVIGRGNPLLAGFIISHWK